MSCLWRRYGKSCPQRPVFCIVKGCKGIVGCIVNATRPAVPGMIAEMFVVAAESLAINCSGEIGLPVVAVVAWLRLLLGVPVIHVGNHLDFQHFPPIVGYVVHSKGVLHHGNPYFSLSGHKGGQLEV